MKNIFPLLPLLLAGGLVSCGNKEKAEFKKSFTESCEQQAGAQVTDNRIVPLLHDYCECSAEQIWNKTSEEERAALQDPDVTPEVRAKMLNITGPCLKELQAKSAKLAR